MRLSGAKTKKDTVNLALREFAARHRRVAALEHFATLAEGWDFEGWQRQRTAEKIRRDPLSPSERRCGSRLCTERLISDLPGSRYALGHGH
jgi:hypothetical protein